MKLRNTLGDLNNHLFAQLERLSDEDISADQLKDEITRAQAVTSVANSIISNGNLILQAKKFSANKIDDDENLPKMLQG